MTRRYIPPTGVLEQGWYWVEDSKPQGEVAFWNGYVWYVAGDEEPQRDCVPISKPLRKPA